MQAQREKCDPLRGWRRPARYNAETHGAVPDAVNEARKPGVADNAQRSAGRTHGRCRRIVPRLKENRFDDIHPKFRR